MSTKAAIRHLALARRGAIQPDDRAEFNAAIAKRVLELSEFKAVQRVLFYTSFGQEVDTHNLMSRCFGGKTVLAPRVKGDGLHVHALSGPGDLQPGAFGILEPVPGVGEIEASEVQAVVVPGAAFDLHGNRIGYGKGYYDRLLAGVNALKIGLAFECQIVDSIPAESHDIAMDILVTEERLVDFR